MGCSFHQGITACSGVGLFHRLQVSLSSVVVIRVLEWTACFTVVFITWKCSGCGEGLLLPNRLAEPERIRSIGSQWTPLLPLRASWGCKGPIVPYFGIKFQGAQMSEGTRARGSLGATWKPRGHMVWTIVVVLLFWLLAAKWSLASLKNECGGSLYSV